MDTTESRRNRQWLQTAMLAAVLVGATPQAALAMPMPQEVPGLDGVTVPAISPTPSPTPSPSPAKPPRRLLPPPQVVPEPELGPIGLGLPVGAVRVPVRGRGASPQSSLSPRPTPAPTPVLTLPPQAAPRVPPPGETAAEQGPTDRPVTPGLPQAAATPAPLPINPSTAASPSTLWRDRLPIIAGAALLMLVLSMFGIMMGRRRRRAQQDETVDISTPEAPWPPAPPPPAQPEGIAPSVSPALPVPPAPSMLRPALPAAPPVLRPWIEIDFVAKRAGTNLTSATVDFELAVRNIGSVVANDIRIMVQLLTANPQQNAQLHAVFGRHADQPILAPFALDPDDTAKINAVGTLALEKITRLEFQGRPMFVPIMAIRAVYGWAGDRASDKGEGGCTANAYILGVDRDGHDKMQPLWLDVGPRMADRVTYRLHEIGIRR